MMAKKSSKSGRSLKARMLAFVLAFVMVFGSLPVSASAAETENTAPKAEGNYVETADTLAAWQMKSAATHGNNHPDDASGKAFWALAGEETITGENFTVHVTSVSAKSEARGGFVNKYADESNWSFIGWDAGNWYVQVPGTNNPDYQSLSGIAVPEAGDELEISGAWQEDGSMKVTVHNVTKDRNEEASVTHEAFKALKDQAGKFGFRAGSYGSALTELKIQDVKIDGRGYYAGDWTSLFEAQDGQILQKIETTEPEPEPGPEEPAEGRKWFHLEGGPNNAGGHAYGNPGARAPVAVVDQEKTMPLDGSLSLAFKPVSEGTPNFGIFYSYVDDNNWLYVGYDQSSGWYYQYKDQGRENYPKLSGLPAPIPGEEMKVEISVSHETLKVVVNGVTATTPNQALYTLLSRVNGTGRFGVKTNSQTAVEFADVKLGTENCMEDQWGYLAERSGQIFTEKYAKLVNVGGIVKDAADQTPLQGAVVRMGVYSAATDEKGHFSMENVQTDTYNASVALRGYESLEQEVVVSETTDALSFELTKKAAVDLNAFHKIQSEDMTVYVAKNFPRVYRYDIGGKPAMYGNETEITSFGLNGAKVTPAVTAEEPAEGADSVVYTLAVNEGSLQLTMKVKISVAGQNLTWEIISIDKEEGCPLIANIDFSDLNLATIDQYSEATEFIGAKKSTNTTVSGDDRITFDDGFISGDKAGYLYAFVSGNGYSAGLFSNSEAEGDARIIRRNGADTISLNSAPWYYEKGDKGGQRYKNAAEGYKKSELPVAKICVAADMNDDKVVNWQDGAIAFRSIMNVPAGSENIKDMVNYRIVMNFASAAPNPFLETADNIKKVYLATDGLPQSVMLKGYGNEGHDSANSEYADIAEREGGVEDFQKLIEIAHKYDTEIGIHVNAQEAYQEAASFSDTMVGAPNYGKGWGWLDQSFVIDKLWDLQSQARYKRFVQLYDRINGTSFYSKAWNVDNKSEGAVGESTGVLQDAKGTPFATPEAAMAAISADAAKRSDNMDFIYLDVWYQDSWETRRIAEEINSLGWRFSTEFSDQGEYDSTWQHWATDAVYGGAGMKGFNSEVIRFIRNDQRDSQVLNYPNFGGTADNPLLGGYRLYGFEGWQGDQNYTNYIYNTFRENLPTKFLQHYQVTNWVDYAEDEACPTGNKEKQITLKNGKDTVVVTRVEEQRRDDNIEREITLNGRTVLRCDADEFAYLLPWTEKDGTEKLYHWNLDGGDTTWKLPADWTGSVMVYELTDQGRVNGKAVEIADDSTIALTKVKAGTAYVVVKEEGVKALEADYGEMDYVTDPGFNGYVDGEKLSEKEWTGDLDAFTVKTGRRGDQYVEVADVQKDVSASTTIHGLTAGKDYVAEIYVDNRSDAKAILEITNGTEVLSNYTVRSIAQNYFKCDEQHTVVGNASAASYMQHILIPFTAKGTEATFTLKREAGEGVTMWDDIRVVNQKIDNYKADGSFVQDFESVVQEFYPFVLGSAQGVEDPVTHLSEANGKYTSTGWNGRVIDDVIEGKYSLKHHGQNRGIIYQTIPQNFRFEPGKSYEVTFDYQTGVSGAYAIVVGDGTNYQIPSSLLESTVGKGTAQGSLKVKGSESGQTWIGLYCNGSNNGDVMGQKDFILDNVVIREEKDPVVITVESDRTEFFPNEKVQLRASNAEGGEWVSSNEEVLTVDENGLVTIVAKGTATVTVTAKNGKSDSVTLTVIEEKVTVISPAENGAAANTQETEGEPGGAVNVTDGDTSTIWHSAYTPSKFTVSEQNPAIITVDFGEEKDLTGFYFQQRSGGGVNGLVKKFQWAVGSQFDAENHTITDGQLSDAVETDTGAGAKVETAFGGVKTARYLQIRVLNGNNGFAAMAEVAGVFAQKPATEAVIRGDKNQLEKGEKVTLTAQAAEGKGDFLLAPFTWTSSDEKVAAVQMDEKAGESAVVTAVGKGTATITFKTSNGVSAAFEITVSENKPEVTLKSIKVTAPTKTTYEVGEKLDLAGMKVTAVYSDNSEKEVTTGYKVENVDMTTAGTKTVKVTYEGKEASFTITVNAKKPEVTLKSIKVTAPTKTTYEVGEELNLAGMKVVAVYSDNTEKEVTTGYKVGNVDMTTAGTKTVKVTYEGKEASFTITVNAKKPEVTLKSIKVTAPTKTTYEVGEELDLAGMKVVAVYSDNTEKEVTTGYKVEDVDMTTAGTKTVKVTYEGKEASFTITVNEKAAEDFFPDVTKDDYFYDPVKWADGNDIVKGYGDTGKFMPHMDCTRANVVTFLYRAAGEPVPEGKEKHNFTDVPADAYYATALQWAYENDIVEGYGDTGKFMPDAPCTRANIVTFLHRAAGEPAPEGKDAYDFADVPADAYYAAALQWAYENKIVQGYGNTGKFMPDNICSRAQTVTFLYRAEKLK